jgi:diacylglycerol kinase
VNVKYAKDVSAGAVLVSVLVSVVTGIIVFMPHIIELFS